MKNLFFLFILAFCSYSYCQKDTSSDKKIKLRFESKYWDGSNYAAVTYLDSTPKFSKIFRLQNRNMLVALFNGNAHGVVGTYIEFANTWQPLHQQFIEYGNEFSSSKLIEYNESKYLYFENFIYGGSADNASCNFTLYDIIDNKLYELPYNGYNNNNVPFRQIMMGAFDFKELLKYPDILAILEKEASQSRMIKRN